MVERFASIEAFKAHGASATMAEHQPLLAAVLDGPAEVTVLEPVVFGEAAKGSLAG
jgi:quinol monooxygenase YgiN